MDLKNMEQLNNSFIVIQNDKTIKFLDQQYLFVEKPTECGVFTLKQLVSLADITDLIYTFWGVAYGCY